MEMPGSIASFDTGFSSHVDPYNLVDSEKSLQEEILNLLDLVAHTFGTTEVAAGLAGSNRQWKILSRDGSRTEIPSITKFCRTAMASEGASVIRAATREARIDLSQDERSYGDVTVAPIKHPLGFHMGALCVFHKEEPTDKARDRIALLEKYALLASGIVQSHKKEQLAQIATQIVQASPEAVVAADRDRKLVYLNPAAENMFGYSASEALGQDIAILTATDVERRQKQLYQTIVEKGASRLMGSFVEFQARHAEGYDFPVEMSFARWRGSDGECGVGAVIRDISDREELKRERHRMELFLDTVIQNLPAMLYVKDAETQKYLLVNQKAQTLVGRSAENMIGHTDSELFPGIGEEYQKRDLKAIEGSEQTTFESEFTRDDGEKRKLRTTRIVIDGPERPNQFLLGLSEDTTELRRVEDENRRLATYDSVTGLLNRATFFEHIQRLVAIHRPFALVSIDLDRFKTVNDQFGHPVGDAVLSEVAVRIQNLLETSDVAARIGGDEFVVILCGEDVRQRANSFCHALIESIAEPIFANGKVLHVGLSAGVAVHPEDAGTVDGLREYSDLALYRAKGDGRRQICFYDSTMDAARREQLQLESDLRIALERQDLFLEYQPIVSASNGEVTCFEALARWRLNGQGMIPPSVFIPLAEDCGLIEGLGQQILNRACVEAKCWPSHVHLAVNLSPMQFRSGNLVEAVQSALDVSGLEASRLQLEVTERLVIEEQDQAFKTFDALHALGIQILLDDFGVGHSALNYFQRFPFDKVKIDKSFVREIETSHAAKSIVKAVVNLASNLSMDVVAEGVETQKQLELLSALGCSHLQGYAISKPLDLSASEKMIFAT